MVIRDIPYLDAQRALLIGAIVTKLDHIDPSHVQQEDHQVFFAGNIPHNIDGTPIPNLGGGNTSLTLSEACSDVVVQRSFSNKPRKTGKFVDFFEKVESYVAILSGPAMELYGVTPYTFRVSQNVVSDSPFLFQDTLTSRAEIGDIQKLFQDDVVAIIGLGGTGSYVLDFLTKTPVREIRAFDFDHFHVHNAFRSPGLTNENEFGKHKSDVFHARYSNFHKKLSVKPKAIDASCADDLDGVTFAFVCVDKGSSRAGIFDLLIATGIPYIDVGMGLDRKHVALNGMLRATFFKPEKADVTRSMELAEENDGPADLYRTNIQIGELNALNACLAVIRFKQLRGFYHEEVANDHLLFEIGDLKVVGEPLYNEN